jgi:hypothetical protein
LRFCDWPEEIKEKISFFALSREYPRWTEQEEIFLQNKCQEVIKESIVQGTRRHSEASEGPLTITLDHIDTQFVIGYLFQQMQFEISAEREPPKQRLQ